MTDILCRCGHPESVHETIEYRGDKPRACTVCHVHTCRNFSPQSTAYKKWLAFVKLLVLEDVTVSMVRTAVSDIVTDYEAELDRLKSGKFTKAEIHEMCHNLHGTVSATEFADGCAAEQLKLYGQAPDRELLKRIIVGWDSDDDLDFLAAIRAARIKCGFKLKPDMDEDEVTMLLANGYDHEGNRIG